MNKLYIMIFSFILFLSCSNAGKINWESDFEASVEKSKSENKIIMMDIYTDWCGACKEMDKNVFRNKNVADSSTNFIALKFNPEKMPNGKDILKKYNILGFPTMLFINSDGFILKRIVGYIESDELINEMNSMKEINDRVNAIFKDDNISLDKLDIYLESGYDNEALDMYNKLTEENKIPEDKMARYMSSIALLLLDNDKQDEGMKYFNEIISKYSNYNEVYIAHYYKALDMIINNAQTNEGIKYIENLTNQVLDGIKNEYLDFISYFGSN
ncbi:thiol-disulfide interchange protein DsbD-like protein [Brachyspira hampsonii 30446]|uniref:Thiol-disulfide interchange protein DsbD-like protein n=1 Tax=Brachyspira hampsonii 30446 TaxID=1289135 RepID=A0A2U4EZA6_9SPIR|nr:thioredoxin fold domain-containing protein [Brachyspira hampsonii]EKV56982.1 thiol-disulfide interchange protein DsbD-like protein [Brachyspira hampsonii 30446]MBW5393523.1 DUF255 domain-containing protein [Brachyspira hampsonii]OEJ16431.1 thiol:disulfide interchange protein [Brachyspira hampsonii]